jgi:ankyrin repeat protein
MADRAKEFIKAAKRGDLVALGALYEADASLIGARDGDGSTALHCAAWKGHEAVVAWLLEVGADVHAHNANDHWGTTALHAAAHANQAKIAERLIDSGADVNARDGSGRTPMFHTTFHKAKAAARVLEKYGGA